MSAHKFKIGDVVTYVQQRRFQSAGVYDVIRLLPSDTPDPGYRLKSQGEKHERVANEHELRIADLSDKNVE